MTEFTHLHVHSDYSLLDGLGRIPVLAEQAEKQGMSAVALTDHGVMFGAIDFYDAMSARGIKPIVGYEAYIASGSHRERAGSSFHLTLLAQDNDGYSNLMQLTTKGHLDGFYRKPRVDHDLLRLHSKGVICLSGCASSEISQAILEGNDDLAIDLIEWHREVYGEGFYLELQDHGLGFQTTLNRKLVELGQKHGIGLVATNDVHYVRADQAAVHDILLCVQTQTTVNDPKRMKMDTQEFYLKSAQEMEKLFGHIDGALSNTMAIAERCNVNLDFGRTQVLPEPAVPEGESPESFLRTSCDAGIRERYGQDPAADVRDRLDYELKIIEKTGYVDYMLLVNEFIQFAKSRGIAIGVRGSAGGSIVGYVLGITNVDPMSLGLSFERFLNPERVSMPDVDIDIADDRREELIQYVTERFGRDHVAQIISFGTMAARAALRDVGRAIGVNLAAIDRVAKLVPFNTDLSEALEKVPDFRAIYDEDSSMKQLVDVARELEGVARHASTHAAGIVISAEPLAEHVPLYRVPKGEAVTTQYAMNPLDKLGLLKMDFLGLRTLTVLQRAIDLVQRSTGRQLTLEEIPLEDPGIFELLGRGETFGIFQVDGSGMRRLLREMQPDRFDDIIALIALYRPGPMQFIDQFVRRRNGSLPVTFPHESLANALADTYGIVVYQEQVVRMVVEVAGFTMGEADLVRKAMAKKQPELLAKYRKDFVKGALKQGTEARVADELFDIIQEFSGYGFNKAHSAAYAVITCQTAYLKAHHPVEYMAAFLSAERENSDKVSEALAECRRLRIAILAPDVNASEIDFSIEGNGIRFGLGAIKNVGATAAESVVRERTEGGTFASVGDLCRRLDWQMVNKRTLESLIRAGALDRLGDRGRLDFNLDRLVAYGQRTARDSASGQVSLFGEAEAESLEPQLEVGSNGDPAAWLRWEKEMIGSYLSHHPLEDSVERIRKLGIRRVSDIDEECDGQTFLIGGIVSGVRAFTTKRGDQMATIELDDLDGSVGVVVYPRVFRKYEELVQTDRVVVIEGTVGVGDGRVEIRAESFMDLASPELDERVEQPSGEVNGELAGGAEPEARNPIPFPAPRASRDIDGQVNRLIVHFHRSEDRSDDLRKILDVYRAVLRHPGEDRIVVVVHSGAYVRQLQLPVDSAKLNDKLQAEIAAIVPRADFKVEQLGA